MTTLLDELIQKRFELKSLWLRESSIIEELKKYDEIWFKNITPHLFYVPLKNNLIDLNIKRFKLADKLNTIIELSGSSLSKTQTKKECNVCKNKLIDLGKGKMYCEKCNINDDIIFNKKGVYSTQKHLQSWLDYIIGREEDNLDEIKDKIVNILNNKNINVNDVTIYDIRRCLKQCKATKHNKSLTKLYREVTGKETPTLCMETEALVVKYVRIISLNVELNMKFYPYYIYKLVELFGSKEDKRVLKFIYLQSNQTIVERDKSWREICKELNIKFISTL